MPKRQVTRKIPSPDIQGDDSWVIVKPMTYGEQKTFRREIQELEDQDLAEEKGCQLIAKWVVDWNWVDDNGDPLPKPVDKPEILDSLLEHEIMFLISKLRGDQEELKN